MLSGANAEGGAASQPSAAVEGKESRSDSCCVGVAGGGAGWLPAERQGAKRLSQARRVLGGGYRLPIQGVELEGGLVPPLARLAERGLRPSVLTKIFDKNHNRAGSGTQPCLVLRAVLSGKGRQWVSFHLRGIPSSAIGQPCCTFLGSRFRAGVHRPEGETPA